jgi:hypothetical protein
VLDGRYHHQDLLLLTDPHVVSVRYLIGVMQTYTTFRNTYRPVNKQQQQTTMATTTTATTTTNNNKQQQQQQQQRHRKQKQQQQEQEQHPNGLVSPSRHSSELHRRQSLIHVRGCLDG